MSFIKYAEDPSLRVSNGRGDLHFGRVHIDGLPFRGSPTMLRESEFEKYTEIVYDADVGLFELTDPEHQQQLRKIIDNAVNGVYRVIRYDHHWYTKENGEPGLKVFIVWCSAQREIARYRMQHPGVP